jgi:hypothetical protein
MQRYPSVISWRVALLQIHSLSFQAAVAHTDDERINSLTVQLAEAKSEADTREKALRKQLKEAILRLKEQSVQVEQLHS